MAGASRNRKSRRRQLKASHQKNWLVGRYAVLETLRAAKWPADELYITDDADQAVAEEIRQLAEQQNTAVQVVTSDRLEELCHAAHHQGLAARMGQYPYDTIDSVVEKLTRTSIAHPLILICDRIQDTFNFGAILRCCDVLGVATVLIAEKEQTLVNPQVARSSAGAVNHVSIALVENLRNATKLLIDQRIMIAAASEKSFSLGTG